MLRYVVLIACTGACQFSPSSAAGLPDSAVDSPLEAGDVVPWLDPWTHRKSITLLASQIEAPDDGALTAFPVLISVTDAALGAIASADGSDLVFTAADAITPLERELESYSSGQLVAWVKIPSLSATIDTKIYVYYGNANAPASSPELVWTEKYVAVYHLHQDPGPGTAGDIRDATANHRDGTAEPGMEPANSMAGQIGRALELDGVTDFIDVPAVTDMGNAFTISVWMNLANVGQIRSLLSNSSDGSNTDGFRFFVNTNGMADRRIRFETGNGGASDSAVTGANAITSGQWAHVVAIVDRGQSTATIVVNGAIANAGDLSIRNDFQTTSDFELGRMESNNQFAGLLDEIEVASTTRPLQWIQTAFNNQSAPASFHVFGAEETK